jgi:hypothetical protein
MPYAPQRVKGTDDDDDCDDDDDDDDDDDGGDDDDDDDDEGVSAMQPLPERAEILIHATQYCKRDLVPP